MENVLQVAPRDSVQLQDYSEMDRILAYSHHCKNLINPSTRSDQKTPLQKLVLHNQSEQVRKLLDLGADVNAAAGDLRGATVLQFSAMNGNFRIADMLIHAGAEVNAKPAPVGGRTAIEGAAEWVA